MGFVIIKGSKYVFRGMGFVRATGVKGFNGDICASEGSNNTSANGANYSTSVGDGNVVGFDGGTRTCCVSDTNHMHHGKKEG